MTDNRALWELVEKWESESEEDLLEARTVLKACIYELRDILERPVVVEAEDVETAIDAYDKAYSPKARGHENKQMAMRAALESMVRGKS
jgi:hypothetical protein